jgi:hypothetical protein
MVDPLITDDLALLLQAFPNDTLRAIVGVLKARWSLSLFPAARAYEVHRINDDGDFTGHANEIAAEILWWGSNDLVRQFYGMPSWRDVLAQVAVSVGVPAATLARDTPAWMIESKILQKALADWDKLTPKQREEALAKAGIDLGAIPGAVIAGAGGAAMLGADALAAFLAQRGVAALFAGTFLAPIALVAGVAWSAYSIAGPAHRVLRPVALVIAVTRQCMRDERAANAFQE